MGGALLLSAAVKLKSLVSRRFIGIWTPRIIVSPKRDEILLAIILELDYLIFRAV